MLKKDLHLPFLELWKTGMVTISMSNIISTARVIIVMFNTKLDDFSLWKFKLFAMYGDLFADVVCKQNELC